MTKTYFLTRMASVLNHKLNNERKKTTTTKKNWKLIVIHFYRGNTLTANMDFKDAVYSGTFAIWS